jgi:c-di-GMP-binding flagellar brake protein YcgR
LIENRKTYRKEVQLNSYYLKLPSTTERGTMAVKDVSLGGIGFTTSESAKHNFSEGDHIWLTFELDDKKQSKIEQSAVVIFVKDRHIGCEFTNLSEQNRKLLGFYLMP